jgi:predicted DNA-binding WGR domain protein
MRRTAQQKLPSAGPGVEEVARFEQFVRLIRPDRARSRPRIYTLRWETPLFSERTLVRTFGPQGTEGRTVTHSYPDAVSARREITRLLHRRLRRGYQIADWQ